MEILESIKTRRSIREFKEKDVPQEIIDDIIECGMNAPSSCNTQPWAFIVVKDKDKLKKLSQVSQYASFVQNAPVSIVVCLTPDTPSFSPNKYNSVACAVQNMLLAIHAYGLGSCWTFVKDFDDTEVERKTKEILNVPEDIEAICILPIGYPNQQPKKKILKDKDRVIHIEEW